MTTDAQRRATAAYRKKSVKQLVVRFWPNDDEGQVIAASLR